MRRSQSEPVDASSSLAPSHLPIAASSTTRRNWASSRAGCLSRAGRRLLTAALLAPEALLRPRAPGLPSQGQEALTALRREPGARRPQWDGGLRTRSQAPGHSWYRRHQQSSGHIRQWRDRQGPGAKGGEPEPRPHPDGRSRSRAFRSTGLRPAHRPEARSRGAPSQEEAEQDAHKGVAKVQAGLLHEQKDDHAEEHDGREASDHGPPPTKGACRNAGVPAVPSPASDPAAGAVPAVRVRPRTPWTPGGHVQGQLRAAARGAGAPERSAPRRFVGAVHCGSPRVMGKRAVHTFRR